MILTQILQLVGKQFTQWTFTNVRKKGELKDHKNYFKEHLKQRTNSFLTHFGSVWLTNNDHWFATVW